MYNREHDPSDRILDYWHPWEKAAYLDYFENREKVKQEYKKYYESSILKKGIADLKAIEYPAKGRDI